MALPGYEVISQRVDLDSVTGGKVGFTLHAPEGKVFVGGGFKAVDTASTYYTPEPPTPGVKVLENGPLLGMSTRWAVEVYSETPLRLYVYGVVVAA